jgi:hypothetical protein
LYWNIAKSIFVQQVPVQKVQQVPVQKVFSAFSTTSSSTKKYLVLLVQKILVVLEYLVHQAPVQKVCSP